MDYVNTIIKLCEMAGEIIIDCHGNLRNRCPVIESLRMNEFFYYDLKRSVDVFVSFSVFFWRQLAGSIEVLDGHLRTERNENREFPDSQKPIGFHDGHGRPIAV